MSNTMLLLAIAVTTSKVMSRSSIRSTKVRYEFWREAMMSFCSGCRLWSWDAPYTGGGGGGDIGSTPTMCQTV